jgi:hypothetical protein
MSVTFAGSVRFSNTSVQITEDVIQIPFTEQLFTTTGAGTWVKPAGITEVIVECWAGGGAGGGAPALKSAGGGGAGGYYVKKTIIYGSAQQSISYSVAASVAGGTGAGANGNDTTWQTNVVVAKGGLGGSAGVNQADAPGGSSTVAGNIGDVIIEGNFGSAGTYNADFGFGDSVTGGFAGAGPARFTQEITNNLSGLGGDSVFNLSSGGAAGGPGENYAAGGGGGARYSGGNQSGGAGAQGVIRISYR